MRRENHNIGVDRLMNQLLAFRDTYIELEAIPLLQGVADRINHPALDKEFSLVTEHHRDSIGAKFLVIHLHGMIFTRYDRKLTKELQNEIEFENVSQQDIYVDQRMRETVYLFEEIGRLHNTNVYNEIPKNTMVSQLLYEKFYKIFRKCLNVDKKRNLIRSNRKIEKSSDVDA